MSNMTLRPAIAMIELIFSIVIMGIVMLSAPILISTASKSTSVALQQEGINEAAARINMILTYDWDENNVNVPCINAPSILVTTNGDPALSQRVGASRRIGVNPSTRPTTTHTFYCLGTEYNASSTLGLETVGTYNDIDDFDGDTQLKTITGLGAGAEIGVDYIEQSTVKITSAVAYSDDSATYTDKTITDFNPGTAAAATTNIKSIAVTLTSTNSAEELQKEIKLQAFSCNLGSYGFHIGVMP